jgi:negative regulator of sigma E activity
MNDDLDGRLRRALRPVDPGEQFTQRVLTRIANEPARSTRQISRTLMRWASAALAASLILVVLATHSWQARRTQQGLEARQQLLEALRVTSDKLDIAYRAVNDNETPSGQTHGRRGS